MTTMVFVMMVFVMMMMTTMYGDTRVASPSRGARRALLVASPSSSTYGARKDGDGARARGGATMKSSAKLSKYDDDASRGYVSVGAIPPLARALNGMDLEGNGRQNIFRAAYERSYKGELILINTNAGGLALAMNVVSNLRSVGIEHFLLYTNSEETCREKVLLVKNNDVDCAWTSYMKNHPRLQMFKLLREDGADAFRLWWSRFSYMYELSGVGYNVMYVDTDVSFRYNPYPVFKNKDAPLRSFNVFAQAEGNGVNRLNVGFMYIQNAKPDGVARGIFNETISRMLAVLESDPPLKNWRGEIAAGAKESLWDQHIFNDVVLSAVVGRFVDLRQGERVIEPSQRESWAESHVPPFPSELEKKWTVERRAVAKRFLPAGARSNDGDRDGKFDVYYRKLKALKGWTSYDDEYVAAPPFWFIDGWTGAGWSPRTQGANNAWLGKDVPVIMTHFVGGQDKPLEMKALGWWDYRATEKYVTNGGRIITTKGGNGDDENGYEDIEDIINHDNGFIAVQGLKIDAATSVEALYKIKLQTHRLIKLGLMLNRTVITPSVSCDEPYIDRRNEAKFGVWSQNNFVMSARCGLNSARTCCLPKRMSCPGLTLGWIDFFDDVQYATLHHQDTQTRVSVDAVLERARPGEDRGASAPKFVDFDRLARVSHRRHAATRDDAITNGAPISFPDVLVIDVTSNDGEIPDARDDARVRRALDRARDQCSRGFFLKAPAGAVPANLTFHYPW